MSRAVPTFDQIRVENTTHCGHRCFFCPREKLTRPAGFMGIDDLTLVLDAVADAAGGFSGEFHLHGFGEPLLDKTLPEKIRLVRRRLPNCLPVVFSTLGLPLSEDRLRALAFSGLHAIVVSFYGYTAESYRRIHGVSMFDTALANLRTLERFVAEGSPLTIIVKPVGKDVYDSIGMAGELERFAAAGAPQQEVMLHNHGDGRDYNVPLSPAERMCSIVKGVRRNILQVTWDLDVIPCTYDFDATVVFGNLRRQSLEEVFSSPEYEAFIAAHRAGDLAAYPACAGCDAGPFHPRPRE